MTVDNSVAGYIKVADTGIVNSYIKIANIVKLDAVFIPNPVVGLQTNTSPVGAVKGTIKIKLADQSEITWAINKITGRPTWVETVAGLNIALAEIASWT